MSRGYRTEILISLYDDVVEWGYLHRRVGIRSSFSIFRLFIQIFLLYLRLRFKRVVEEEIFSFSRIKFCIKGLSLRGFRRRNWIEMSSYVISLKRFRIEIELVFNERTSVNLLLRLRISRSKDTHFTRNDWKISGVRTKISSTALHLRS